MFSCSTASFALSDSAFHTKPSQHPPQITVPACVQVMWGQHCWSPTFPPGWTRGSGRRTGPGRRWRCRSPPPCRRPSWCRPRTPRRRLNRTSRSDARPPSRWSPSRWWKTWARACGRPSAHWHNRGRLGSWGGDCVGTQMKDRWGGRTVKEATAAEKTDNITLLKWT